MTLWARLMRLRCRYWDYHTWGGHKPLDAPDEDRLGALRVKANEVWNGDQVGSFHVSDISFLIRLVDGARTPRCHWCGCSIWRGK